MQDFNDRDSDSSSDVSVKSGGVFEVQIKHEIRSAHLRWHGWSFNLLSGLYKATLWLRVGVILEF